MPSFRVKAVLKGIVYNTQIPDGINDYLNKKECLE